MAISNSLTLADTQTTKPLRFITCGNVDDGKSTLIGRLLWDTNTVKSDQKGAIEAKPVRLPNGEMHPDYANLLDGLQAEQEQGITIDVAYRYFSTAKRSFIVADTPGHEQYTRNMITGASNAQVAVLLIDAQNGLTEQTKRHAKIASLLGIKELILVINKMDLVDFQELHFSLIEKEFNELSEWLGIENYSTIPTAAVLGYNVVHRDAEFMYWYKGPTLLEALQQSDPIEASNSDFRLCVQRVARPDESFRGFQGSVTGGSVRPGQDVVVLPSYQKAKVEALHTFDGPVDEAHDNDAVTVVLDRKIDISRGDFIVDAKNLPKSTQQIQADMMVFADEGLSASKRYWLKTQSRRQRVRINPISQINLQSGEWEEDSELSANAIVKAEVSFDEAVFFDTYANNRTTGSFILIDPDDFRTVAGGMMREDAGHDASLNVIEGVTSDEKLVHLFLPPDLAEELLRSKAAEECLSEIRLEASAELLKAEPWAQSFRQSA